MENETAMEMRQNDKARCGQRAKLARCKCDNEQRLEPIKDPASVWQLGDHSISLRGTKPMPCFSLVVRSARDFDPLCVNPSVVLGKQRSNHRTDVIGKADSAEQDSFFYPLIHFRVVADDTSAEIGRRSRRSGNIHRDPPGCQLLSKTARHLSVGHVTRKCELICVEFTIGDYLKDSCPDSDTAVFSLLIFFSGQAVPWAQTDIFRSCPYRWCWRKHNHSWNSGHFPSAWRLVRWDWPVLRFPLR